MIPTFRMGVIASEMLRVGVPTSDLLLHFEGSTIVDSGKHFISITPSGGAALSTSNPKFGTQSLALTGGYLPINNSALVIGLQDFTNDLWCSFTAFSSQTFILDSRTGAGTANGYGLFENSGKIVYYDGTNNLIISTTTLALNTMHHIQVCRASGIVYLFIDGVLQGTGTDGGNKVSSQWTIGAGQFFPEGVSPMTGFMDEFHLLIGTATNTTSFTPPTSAYTS